MRLADLAGHDPNRLGYRVYTPLGEPVAVHFEPLTPADLPELSGPRWQGARFLASWLASTGAQTTWKLVLSGDVRSDIEGIIKIGHVTLGSRSLRESMLESAPVNQVPQAVTAGRLLRGVGKVLVARLVVESVSVGGDGSVLVLSTGLSMAFYTGIGFRPLNIPNRYILDADKGDDLLASVTTASENDGT